MSLNFTPRIEQCDITEGGEDYTMIARVEAGLPVVPAPVQETAPLGLCGGDDLRAFPLERAWAR